MVNNQLLGYSMVGFVLLVYLRWPHLDGKGGKATDVHILPKCGSSHNLRGLQVTMREQVAHCFQEALRRTNPSAQTIMLNAMNN